MKLFSTTIIGGVMAVMFISGTGVAHADSYSSIFDRLQSRIDQTHARLAERQGHLEKRFEKVRMRIEESNQRLCDRFSRRGLQLPSRCTDEEPEAPTLTFVADPTSVPEGATSTLTWDSEHTDTCEASGGWSGDKALDGSMAVNPQATTTYTLTCTGAGGDVEKSVTVGVTPAEEEPDAPTLTFTADPTSVLEGATSTLTWDSEHTDTCEASGGWSGAKALDGSEVVTVSATTTYTLTCIGDGGTTTESATVAAVEVVVPGVDHLVISEVLYDLAGDGSQGSESGGDNEWIEIYNPTGIAVDLMDWMVGDSTTTADVLATSSHMLPGGAYLVVTDATTTANFWDLSSVDVVYLGSSISGGLANGGDYVALFDASGAAVDEVSYGTNETAFSPSVPDVAEGHSIARDPVNADTDSAGDWADSATPTPGS